MHCEVVVEEGLWLELRDGSDQKTAKMWGLYWLDNSTDIPMPSMYGIFTYIWLIFIAYVSR